ncbi:MAG: haloacid dehalogenase [Chloroflexi bacterium]|nr:haloacid dehalogenase [Chloroflexota bacterium]
MVELEAIADRIRGRFDEKYKSREKGLAQSRLTIRNSANTIRAVHRGEFDLAEDLLQRAAQSLKEVDEALSAHQDIYHAGFVQDAQKEFAEASITLAIIGERSLPTPEELGVGFAPYLNGMAEAIGELRRHILDFLRHGRVQRCEEILQQMDDMYSILVTMDYPDAMTGGLRRSTDVARSILEKTRGDLTAAIGQRQLEDTVREFERKLLEEGQAAKGRRGK